MNLTAWFLWRGEELLSAFFSRIFWPPARVTVLVVKDSQLLTLEVGDYYTLPGGFVKPRESFEDAARRELKEETGLEVKTIERLEERNDTLPGVEIVFRAEAKGDLQGSWEGQPIWVDTSSLPGRWRFNRDVEDLLEKHGLV